MAIRWERSLADFLALLDPTSLPIIVGLLGAVSVAVLVYAFMSPYLSGEKQLESRVVSAAESRNGRAARRVQVEQVQSRRRAVADTLKELESKQKAREKITMHTRLLRAGLRVSGQTFWIFSAVAGLVVSLLTFIAVPTAPLPVFPVIFFAAMFGLSRWYLGFLTKRRQKQFTDEFADAIDVIVRGVKSGLPFSDCIGVIARESPEPVRGIFKEVVDQQRVGVPLPDCFDRILDQMPISELKFFAIVVGIQQQAGGNLSEALGNLSGVIRARKQMQAKIKSLSAEAKASAAVLGSMPFVVSGLIYLSTPAYILVLFNSTVGQFMLICCAVWMTVGILVMRKMINFKI